MGKSICTHKREDFQVTGHPELLRRALDNVLRNGLRFARENGVVTVDLSRKAEENTGVISLEDEGPGIRRDQREMIFEPFVRLRDPATGESEGSGLGLAIARQAVRAKGDKYRLRLKRDWRAHGSD
jgi:two-component system, OmpR family, sensor histidine kinase CpxA